MTDFKVGDRVKRTGGYCVYVSPGVHTVTGVGDNGEIQFDDKNPWHSSTCVKLELVPSEPEPEEAKDTEEPQPWPGYRPSRFDVWSQIPNSSIERLDEVWEWVNRK